MVDANPEQPLGDSPDNLLGNFSDDYQQGLDCEAQGEGILAISYFFKMTEGAIHEMVDRAVDHLLLPPIQEDTEFKSNIKQIQETKGVQARITLLKRAIPTTMPTNIKPLSALHSEFEKGLYLQSNQACLRLANKHRRELRSLITEVVTSRASSQKFVNMMNMFNQRQQDPAT